LALLTAFAIALPAFSQQTLIQYLSGTDKDNTVPWNFSVSSGRNSGIATNIPVPSCWQSQGFGTYSYTQSSSGLSRSNDETGSYSCTFSVPADWAGKRIFLVYEGVLTDTATTVNGQLVAGLFTNAVVAPGSTNQLPNDRSFDDSAASGQGGTGGIALSTNSTLNIGTLNQFTFTAWIRPVADFSTMTGSEYPRILMVGATPGYDTSVTNGAALLGYNTTGTSAALQFTVNTGNLITPSGALTGTNWVFVAATYDSTLANSNVNIYIGSLTTPPTLFSTQTLAAGPVAFGSTAYAYLLNRSALNRAFAGWGDDFRIFNGALSQATLAGVWATALSNNAPASATALYQWNFNFASTGTTVAPNLGSGGTLTMENSSGTAANLYSGIGLGVSDAFGAGGTNYVVTNTSHQGGYTEFQYDITPYLAVGASTNVLQVAVRHWSSNYYVEGAEEGNTDYWIFSGIYRPVYLAAKPAAYIDYVAANPLASGQITVNAYLGGINSNYTVSAFVTDTNHGMLGAPFSTPVSTGATNVSLSASLPAPNPWSSESPTLYTLTVQLLDAGSNLVHTVTNQIGFRTLSFVPNQGFFVNGRRVIMRGICHHEEWPTTGRTTSPTISSNDVALIKDMNFNSVRESHYPHNKSFLTECNRQGLYVLEEMASYQFVIDTADGIQHIYEMIRRDSSDPCIIAWDNGNEGGWNANLDGGNAGATNYYGVFDIQNRQVIRPGANGGNFMNLLDYHYPSSFAAFTNYLGAGKTAFSCTEILHALYDGGGGADLQEYWDALRTAPNGVGMWLWSWDDEGIVRLDLGGILDVRDSHGPDGIVGPYREKEASYYSHKAIYNPVQVGAPNPAAFTGALNITNRFDFTSLSQCTFDWQLGWFPDAADPGATYSTNALTGGLLVALDSGSFAGPALPPGASGTGASGTLVLPSFPANWTNYDALRLSVSDPFGKNLYTWTWPLRAPAQIRDRILGAVSASAPGLTAGTNATEIIVTNGPRVFEFNKSTGQLDSLTVSNQPVSFTNGPAPADGSAWAVSSVTNYSDGTNYYVGMNSLSSQTNAFLWTIRPDGWIKLTYQYWQTGLQNFLGISFNYPNSQLTAMNWLGQGPYRVYKNRAAGQEIFTHAKTYNFPWTGQTTNYGVNYGKPTTQWTYPEFEGYHGQLYWATLQTTEQPITIVTPTSNLFLRVLTPPSTDQAGNYKDPPYPVGGISLLHGIAPIGNKFSLANNMGPAGQTNVATGLYTGEADFFFGPLPPAGTDRDANGLLDSWELAWFGALGQNPASSNDPDRLPLLVENAFNLSPLVLNAQLPEFPHLVPGLATPAALAYAVPDAQNDFYSFVPGLSDNLEQWYWYNVDPGYFLINAAASGAQSNYVINPNLTNWPGNTNRLFMTLGVGKKN
jgi:hypothetical protein